MNSCHKCRFSVPARGPDGKINFQSKTCRRYPPELLLVPGPKGPMLQALWPIVGVHDSCGEFKDNPDAVELPIMGEVPLAEPETEKAN